MSADEPGPTSRAAKNIHPCAWLIVPTVALLCGQAFAAGPWQLPAAAVGILIVPLSLCAWPRWRSCSLLALLATAAFAVGYVRHGQLLKPNFAENHLRSVAARDGRLFLEGQLRQEPEQLVSRVRWRVAALRVWHPTGAEAVSGDILITLRQTRRSWRYGDRLRFWVRPAVPQSSGNPGGFDYATYLARREIYLIGFLDNDQDVELLARDPHPLGGLIENMRREIRQFIEGRLQRDHGALLAALVVGDMGGISKEMRGAFTAAGVNHVLSISGLHVAMLGLVVFALIRYGGSLSSTLALRINLFKTAACFSFVAVVFYTALAGAMVPTVRSAMMIAVYQLAILLDREEEVFASLALAALLIALVWPGVVADISFQLSFLAVLFIIWGMRKVHDWFPVVKGDTLPAERSWLKLRARQAGMHLAVPLLATLGTGPLIAHYFGHLSLAGFVANPLIVPLVGFVVVPLGLLVGFVAVVAPASGSWLAELAEYPVALTAAVVHFFAGLPLASVRVPSLDAWEITGVYALMISLFALKRRAHRFAALAVGTLLLVADGSYWWMERYRRNELRVTHLNVGQGDAAVIELPSARTVVIDAGGTASGEFDIGENIVAPFLRSRKILKVDYLVLTHPRIDHYGGMRAIVSEFAPREFWSGSARGQTGRFDDLEQALAQAKIRRLPLHARQPCREIESVKFCVLYPPPAGSGDTSAVLRLEFGKLRYLFAADIEKRDEALLLDRAEELRSHVVKVPRHGSPAASSEEFVAAVRPRLAIVSAALRSPAGARQQEVLQRYAQANSEILRTHEDGAVVVVSDGEMLRYMGYKSGKKGVIHLGGAAK
jgi:competence protein ComEC